MRKDVNMDFRKRAKDTSRVRLQIVSSALAGCLVAATFITSVAATAAGEPTQVVEINATIADTTVFGTVDIVDDVDVQTPQMSYYLPEVARIAFANRENKLFEYETEPVELDESEDVDPLSLIVEEEEVTTASMAPYVLPQQTEFSYENLYLDITDVRKPSNMTLEQLQKWTERFAPNWVGLESQILEYDKRINLVFLLAVARAETGAGATDGMVGNYNCFNIKGLVSEYVNYNSYIESIDDFVDLLERAYLSPDGIYFNGYGIYDIGIMYAGPHWAPGVVTLADELIWHFDEGSLSD